MEAWKDSGISQVDLVDVEVDLVDVEIAPSLKLGETGGWDDSIVLSRSLMIHVLVNCSIHVSKKNRGEEDSVKRTPGDYIAWVRIYY